MQQLPDHRLVAFNTATASENKIHDDAVAARLGFSGGLVPGVEVYGYLCHPVLERWGERWLAGGVATVRFHRPVYDGEDVVVRAVLDDDPAPGGPGVLRAEAHTAAGPRAGLEARLVEPATVAVPEVPRGDRPAVRPPASPEAFAGRPTLATLAVRCGDDDHARYLAEVDDAASPTTAWGVCHPGWLLRRANDVLVASVELGPWIHVGSTAHHLRPLPRAVDLEVRGRVRDTFERGGHRFVDLDVVITDGADGGPAVVVDHRAIHQPRQVRTDRL